MSWIEFGIGMAVTLPSLAWQAFMSRKPDADEDHAGNRKMFQILLWPGLTIVYVVSAVMMWSGGLVEGLTWEELGLTYLFSLGLLAGISRTGWY